MDYRQGENPARWRGHLQNLLAKSSKVRRVQHFAALPFDQIATFMAELRKFQGISAHALEFAILTAARNGEVNGAAWPEIDMDAGEWVIPASRMKAGREHRVPLSFATISILRERQADTGGQGLVFEVSRVAMVRVLRRMGHNDLTAHGFRSTFRDWASERTAFPRDVCEMALAHTIPNAAEAVYRRGDLFEKRRKLMDAWGAFCTSPPIKRGEVLPMRVTT